MELQQLNTTDLQKENEAKDAEIAELKEKTFVSLQIFFKFSSAYLHLLKTIFFVEIHE